MACSILLLLSFEDVLKEKVTTIQQTNQQTNNYYDYLLKAFCPVNRTGSPEGFSQNQILHELNIIQNVLILHTYIIQNGKLVPSVLLS